MIRRVVGTAGHIDHGKTTLVHALTGVDTDRLKEEKERKISIDIGFAPLTLPSGERVAIIDVPGHERFVKNMLAGVGGIDAVLFTIAADEGVMPQSREHLEIIHFLGVDRGLIVLTKKDLVDEEMLELVSDEVRELFASTSLIDAEIVAVSSTTGDGVQDVLTKLDALLQEPVQRPEHAWFRLPVDRVFASRGFGTVITGTVWSGSVSVGDKLSLLPSGREVRVRKVEVFHEEVESAASSQRTALALHGVDRDEVERGDVLVTPRVLTPTHMIDARIRMSASAGDLRPRQRIRFHIGAAEILGRVIPLETETIASGGEGLVQVRLERPVVAANRDRLIIRSYSPARTIAGGVVIDASPPKRKSGRETTTTFLTMMEAGDQASQIAAILSQSYVSSQSAASIADRLQESEAVVRGELQAMEERGQVLSLGGGWIAAETADAVRSELRSFLEDAKKKGDRESGIPREELRKGLSKVVELPLFSRILQELVDEEICSVHDDRILTERAGLSPAMERRAGELDALLAERKFLAPSMDEIGAALALSGKERGQALELLARLGRIVKVTPEMIYRPAELDELRHIVQERIVENAGMDISSFREASGLSRKYSVPVLEYFDRTGWTRRKGNERVAGPQMERSLEESKGES